MRGESEGKSEPRAEVRCGGATASKYFSNFGRLIILKQNTGDSLFNSVNITVFFFEVHAKRKCFENKPRDLGNFIFETHAFRFFPLPINNFTTWQKGANHAR